jgi:hypothetical protein
VRRRLTTTEAAPNPCRAFCLDRPVDYTSSSWPLEHRLVLRARVALEVPRTEAQARGRVGVPAVGRAEAGEGQEAQVKVAEMDVAAREARAAKVGLRGEVASPAASVRADPSGPVRDGPPPGRTGPNREPDQVEAHRVAAHRRGLRADGTRAR